MSEVGAASKMETEEMMFAKAQACLMFYCGTKTIIQVYPQCRHAVQQIHLNDQRLNCLKLPAEIFETWVPSESVLTEPSKAVRVWPAPPTWIIRSSSKSSISCIVPLVGPATLDQMYSKRSWMLHDRGGKPGEKRAKSWPYCTFPHWQWQKCIRWRRHRPVDVAAFTFPEPHCSDGSFSFKEEGRTTPTSHRQGEGVGIFHSCGVIQIKQWMWMYESNTFG